jgi:hypothetical protein
LYQQVIKYLIINNYYFLYREVKKLHFCDHLEKITILPARGTPCLHFAAVVEARIISCQQTGGDAWSALAAGTPCLLLLQSAFPSTILA